MAIFFINKPLWKHIVYNAFLYFNRSFEWSENKIKDVIKSFEMTLNSKHRTEIIKTKNQRNWSMKSQTTERRKLRFAKRIGKKCKFYNPVLNKIMTTRKLCIKCNFVAPLRIKLTNGNLSHALVDYA